MPLALSVASGRMDSIRSRLGPDGAQEIQEIVIHAVMPEDVRRMLVLTTPCIDAEIGTSLAQELKDWIQTTIRSTMSNPVRGA